MTVASTVARIDYAGAGSVGPYPYPFRIFDADDLEITRRDAFGVETVLTRTTDYSVDGVGEKTGGDVTLVTALAAGESLAIRRQLDALQPTSFRNLGPFLPANHEDAFDRLTMLVQQLDDSLARSARLKRSYTPAAYDLELTPAANQALAWSADGLTLESRAMTDGNGLLPGDGRTVSTLTAYLANNAVFCPLDFGAAGDGVTDDAVALQLCFDKAKLWAVANAIFRRPVIDFRGRCYATSAQIEIPGGGHGYIVQNGRMKPTGVFDDTKYLLATGRAGDATLPDGFKIDNLELRGIYFDNQHIGGGFLSQSFLRTFVHHCIFQGYKTNGLRTAVDGHELMVSNSQFGEYFWNDPITGGVAQDHADLFVGTGIRLETPDNHIHDCVIQLSDVGIRLANSDANLISNVHIWPGYVRTAGTSGVTSTLDHINTCIYVDSASVLNNITHCYFDGGVVIWENPWKGSLTNNLFLNGAGDPAKGMLVFKAVGAGQFIDGVQITGNTFQVNGGGSMKGVLIDSSGGTFNSGQISRCRWTDNAFTNVSKFYSEVSLILSQSGAQDWTWDLYAAGAGLFPFNVVQQIRHSAWQFSGGTQHFRISALAAAAFTISSYNDAAIGTKGNTNATVFAWASLNKTDA